MSLYAYCRVSTERQSLQRQIDNIRKIYPDVEYYTDKYTGTTRDRPHWNRLYKKLHTGDTVVFDSISRMSRSADEGVRLYLELFEKGVELIFLNEPYCNTEVYRQSITQCIQSTGNEIADCYIEATNKVLQILATKQIAIAFEQAEKERNDISNRVKDGMKSRKEAMAEQGITIHYGLEKGTKLTTKKSVKAKEIIRKHSKDFDGTLSDDDVRTLAGISRNTYYKYKAELKTEDN